VGAVGLTAEEIDRPSLSDLAQKLSQCVLAVEDARVNKGYFPILLITSFFLTIIEQGWSIEVLCRNERYFDAKIILRSSLEHLIEMKLLAAGDPKHTERLKLEYNQHLTKSLSDAKAGNPYASKIAEKIELDTELDTELEALAEYKKGIEERGGKKINSHDRFKAAGFSNEYQVMYSDLSKLAHPTFAGVIERNLVLDDSTSGFTIHCNRLAEIETIDVTIGTAIDVLSAALEVFTNHKKL